MYIRSFSWRYLAVATFFLATVGVGRAQTKVLPFNEYEIDTQQHAFDKADIWNLSLRFKAPRVITVDVPGRGKKIVWYMLYGVINQSGEPRVFIPDFVLKTNDSETLHSDEVMPAVQAAISKIEDPTGKLNIKNSVTISKEPIPIFPKESFPRIVWGVAIWTDVYDRAPKTNSLSIFIAGLSDGWKEDPMTKIIRRKTLQLNFKRLGDEFHNDANAIRYVDNYQWLYRATDADLKGEAPVVPEKKKGVLLEKIPDNLAAPRRAEPAPLNLPVPLKDLPVLPSNTIRTTRQ
jgi:hypothetical protein